MVKRENLCDTFVDDSKNISIKPLPEIKFKAPVIQNQIEETDVLEIRKIAHPVGR